MTDRFCGFRYEIRGDFEDGMQSVPRVIQSKADELACFGWVQPVDEGRGVVGEARCNKRNGAVMMDWMRSQIVGTQNSNIKEYENTK